MSNSQSGFSSTPAVERTKSASRALLARLTARHLAVEGGVVRVGLQPAKLIQVRQPAVTDRVVEQLPQARVGEREEPPWRDAVGLVGEPFRPQFVKVFQHTVFEQLGVQRGDAVDPVAADRREVRHPHALAVVLGDQRHPAQPGIVARELGAHLVEEPPVDLVDDLEVPGQ